MARSRRSERRRGERLSLADSSSPVLTWDWLRNVARGGGRSQRPVQLRPVALVDAGDVAIVRHFEVLILHYRL